MKLPNSWKYQSLKDIIKDTQLGVNVKSSVDTVGIPLLKMGNLTIGDFNFNKLENTCELIENIENYYLKYGDFLFNTRNTPELVGKSAVWKWNDKKIIFNSNIMRINFIENIDSFFLGYYFSSKRGWNKLKLISTGTTSVGAIYTKDLLKVKVPLPPLEEQKKIADILSTVDKKIAFVEENINATEELKKGLMQKLLTEGIGHTEFKDSELGRLPESWEIDKLENLTTKIGDGLHGTPKYVEQSDYYFINGNNLNGESIEINKNTKCVNEEEYIKNKKILDNTTILLSINGTVGSLAYYNNENVMLGKSVAYMNVNSKILKQFLFYLLKSSKILEYFILELTGTTIKNLSLKTIRNTRIPLPQLEEQKQIAEILLIVDKKLESLKEKKQSFEELKKGLMQKLLTGKVRV
ncbi:restriction endonuclease subunit S [Aliarcobacter butzleri]|uniref:restriction endonuclease subunit S n=1 Tax=Aliarcobacter butzleri TaxID=28197 RepID=UPI001EDB8F7C|nr:restriction endonuclease subunit S [Aliarcobacter butzleri]MCG3706905.1 restriction endonuclease subunit S [Aliarcobacter butzleri]